MENGNISNPPGQGTVANGADSDLSVNKPMGTKGNMNLGTTSVAKPAKEQFRMCKVMSIEDIAAKCREMNANCVVSVDAPLVTALNARSDAPLFGFAFTPRMIADLEATNVIGSTPDTDLEVCRKIKHITGYSLRFTHSTVKKIREIRRYTTDVKSHLMSNREREVYDAYLQTACVETVMEQYSDPDKRPFFDSRNTVKVDMEFFGELDRWMAPFYCDEISNTEERLFNGDFTIDRIYSIGNDRQIAECIVDLITPENCNDVAIVLDSGGSAADAIRSALYRKDIPFKNDLSVKDLAPIRDFIRFCSAALEFNNVRAGEVRELFSTYGAGYGGLTTRTDSYLLSRIDNTKLGNGSDPDATTLNLIALMRKISEKELSFEDAVNSLPKSAGKGSIKILLRDMNIGQELVTRDLVTDMEYAVNNIDDLKHNEQIPDDERSGVLLADCKRSIYIDRSMVFYVGLDDAWHNSPAGKDYIKDPLQFEEKEAMRMRILLQQGDRRFYIIRPATGGKETTPCQTFETISELEGRHCRIESFDDICGEIVRGSWHEESTTNALPNTDRTNDTKFEDRVVFSKTTYNAWRDCPYKYLFKKLLRDDYEENDNALFGIYIHEFAEFALCYPELAEKNFDKYMGILLDQYSGISSRCLTKLDESRFNTIMRNVMMFVKTIRPDDLLLDGDNSERRNPNILILEEKEITGNRYSTCAEDFYRSVEHAFEAKPDLTIGDVVFDYKTGKAHDTDKIKKRFNGEGKLTSEFQPLFYLKAHLEKTGNPNGKASFRLVYFGNHVAETVYSGNGKPDLKGCIREVSTVPYKGSEYLEETGLLADLFEKHREKGTKKYSLFVENETTATEAIHRIVDTPKWADSLEDASCILAGAFNPRFNKTERGNAEAFLKQVAELTKDITTTGDKIFITSDYLEKFAIALDNDAKTAETVMELPMFTNSRDKVVCDYCEYKSVCMSPQAEDYEGGEEE